MDDRDLHALLRLSVEASPEAPLASVREPLPPDQGVVELTTAEAQCPVPISAWTTPQDSEALAAGLKAKANPAEWAFDRLCRIIEDFESKLSAEEEVGATIVGAPGEGTFHVDDIGFWGPDLIMFYGRNMYGRRVRLIQHYQQLSVLLTALPREEEKPARRIGFALRTRMEEAAAGAAPPPPAPSIDAPSAADETVKPATGAERP